MKKTLLLLTTATFVFITTNLFSNQTGAPTNATGAPGESTCAQAGCHTGTVVNGGGGSAMIMITGDSVSYIPGKTYEINIHVMETGRSKFGFSIVAKDANHLKQGTFAVGGNSGVQVVGSTKYGTHTSGGTLGSTDSKIWKMKWTAPATNVGTITFYAACNAANGNNDESGDHIYTTNLVFPAATTTGVSELINPSTFSVYPNPSNDKLHLQYELKQNSTVLINLLDLTGRLVYTSNESQQKGAQSRSIDLSAFNKGIYLLQMQAGSDVLTQKIAVN
jgi:hypothetical protein